MHRYPCNQPLGLRALQPVGPQVMDSHDTGLDCANQGGMTCQKRKVAFRRAQYDRVRITIKEHPLRGHKLNVEKGRHSSGAFAQSPGLLLSHLNPANIQKGLLGQII